MAYLKNLRLSLAGTLIFLFFPIIYYKYHHNIANSHFNHNTRGTLDYFVMEGINFELMNYVLKDNDLDLGAHVRYNEVKYDSPLILKEVEFDFILKSEAQLNFLYNITDTGFSGLSMIDNINSKPHHFNADNIGKFIETTDYDYQPAKDVWHKFRAEFDSESKFYIDDTLVFQKKENMLQSQFGFRNMGREARVDNLKVRTKDDRVLKENFNFYEKLLTWRWLLTTAIVFASLLGVLSVLSVEKQKWLSRFINFGFVLVISLYFCHAIFINNEYSEINWKINLSIHAEEMFKLDGKVKHSAEPNIEKAVNLSMQPTSADVYKILLVGSSQTWGAGAYKENENFQSQLEKNLHDLNSRKKIKLINRAISGYLANEATALFKQFVTWKPNLVFFNMGSNDYNNPDFEKDLTEFLELARTHSLPVILFKEANSPESSIPGLFENHAIIDKLAVRFNRPVYDLHAHMKAHQHEGFLWWDHVHMTTLGQYIMADFVAKSMSPLP